VREEGRKGGMEGENSWTTHNAFITAAAQAGPAVCSAIDPAVITRRGRLVVAAALIRFATLALYKSGLN